MRIELIQINPDDIVIGSRIRQDLGALASLENSIRRLGLLFPILVDRSNVLISGNRRLAACRQAGPTTVPALRLEAPLDAMSALDVQSDENLCRRPLSAAEMDKLILMKKSFLKGVTRGAVHNAPKWFQRLFSLRRE